MGGGKSDVWQGTLELMVLKTLQMMSPQHGYGLARRIEQTSGDLLELNYGTLYPALLKLEQEGYIRSRWGVSDNNRKAKFYELTKAGEKQVRKATAEWEQTTEILARYMEPLAAGSWLAISFAHFVDEELLAKLYALHTTAPFQNHGIGELASFLGGLDLMTPGIAEVRRWLSGVGGTPTGKSAYMLCGVGTKAS